MEVLYIETKEDLERMNTDLWYTMEDFHFFRKDALRELTEFMNGHGIHDVTAALTLMYNA